MPCCSRNVPAPTTTRVAGVTAAGAALTRRGSVEASPTGSVLTGNTVDFRLRLRPRMCARTGRDHTGGARVPQRRVQGNHPYGVTHRECVHAGVRTHAVGRSAHTQRQGRASLSAARAGANVLVAMKHEAPTANVAKTHPRRTPAMETRIPEAKLGPVHGGRRRTVARPRLFESLSSAVATRRLTLLAAPPERARRRS